jgi:hypothetical protein
VQLGASPGALPASTSIAEALRVAATRLGHRPAVTVLGEGVREEQGFASLLRWAAKGAHLLEIEALTEPGEVLLLDGEVGWATAAVVYAAWWAGLVVSTEDEDPTVAVVGRPPGDRSPGPDAFVYTLEPYSAGTPADAEPWTSAVQTFPDQPPSPRGDGDSLALRTGDRTAWTQSELLTASGRWGDEGVLGISADADALSGLLALVRPLRVGRPTVVIAGGGLEAAKAEGIDRWA